MKRIIPFVIILGGLTILLIFGGDGRVGTIEAGQFASLISLSALAIWIGAGQFPMKGISTHLRNLALWAGIFLAIGVAYTYRFEFMEVKDRFAAALLPGNAVTSVAADGTREVRVTRANDGQFDITGSSQGANLNFLVDTGASMVALTTKDAERVGVDISELRFDRPVSTANGRTNAALTRLPELQIGGITRQNVQVMVSQPGALDTNLLGMSFLNTLTGFRIENDQLILKD